MTAGGSQPVPSGQRAKSFYPEDVNELSTSRFVHALELY